MELINLYQEVILDHNRNPHNVGKIDNADLMAKGFNPLCGDKLDLYLTLEDETILDAKFNGCGCAISTASASLMTDYLKGKTLQQAEEMFGHFHSAIVEKNTGAEIKLGKLAVLTGVKEFPARVKCATLAWHTLQSALKNCEETATTE